MLLFSEDSAKDWDVLSGAKEEVRTALSPRSSFHSGGGGCILTQASCWILFWIPTLHTSKIFCQ